MPALQMAVRLISTTPEIAAVLKANAPVAVGVSGGKDSSACGLATAEYLDAIGHTGSRVLIHADLGATEWKDSLPSCARLAKRIGWELAVVKRPQGDMMERWEQRWKDNVERWEKLSCVKIILPWSTPAMRFCTAELKVDQICRELARRFPHTTIINATGIRWAESTERAKAPISKPQPKLKKDRLGTTGIDWHPIISWSLEDVFEYHK
jgi:3'-phosphoadenosine 5'-phosphosulfate sulfotransferase (PAPS reductase)/FAD synthetase